MIELRWYIDKDDNRTLQWRRPIMQASTGEVVDGDWHAVPTIWAEDTAPEQASDDD